MDNTLTLRVVRMVALSGLLALQACGIAAKDARTGVGVHSINYSGSYYRYLVIDPDNPKNSAGGEEIHPYAAGGLMCCYALPDQWRPGLKAKVRFRVSVMRDGQWDEDLKEELVEVPAYAKGDPPELWVVRAEDGSASVVLSNANPSHPDWPGKVKGWPVPSIEYQRQLWDQHIKHEQGNVSLFENLLSELKTNPKSRAEDAWSHTKERFPKDVVGFTGPSDEKFISTLRRQYEDGLSRAILRVKKLRESRP